MLRRRSWWLAHAEYVLSSTVRWARRPPLNALPGLVWPHSTAVINRQRRADRPLSCGTSPASAFASHSPCWAVRSPPARVACRPAAQVSRVRAPPAWHSSIFAQQVSTQQGEGGQAQGIECMSSARQTPCMHRCAQQQQQQQQQATCVGIWRSLSLSSPQHSSSADRVVGGRIAPAVLGLLS